MVKILKVFVLSALIWVPGMALVWVVGISLNCAFIRGCYHTLGVVGLLSASSVKSIVVKGMLLSAVTTAIGCGSMHRR
jgi:hypothetical protein